MLAPGKKNNTLTNIILFNKVLFAVLGTNLFIYSATTSFSFNIMLALCWTVLATSFITNETIGKTIKSNKKLKNESKKYLTRLNIALTSASILTVAFFTGNISFLYLYFVPIMYSLLCSYKKQTLLMFASAALLLNIADSSGWMNNPDLIINKIHTVPIVITFISVMGVLTIIGIIFSNYIKIASKRTNSLYTLATRDALTGLINKRELTKRLIEEMARSKRHKSTLTLAMFDVDFFKKINDTYGHVAGDIVLKEIGRLVKENTRTSDVAARYGGEEFAIVLPETTKQEAYELLERIRITIQNNVFQHGLIPIKATISVGIAQFGINDVNAEVLCNRADKALYHAKNTGRNRVECDFNIPTPKNYVIEEKIAVGL